MIKAPPQSGGSPPAGPTHQVCKPQRRLLGLSEPKSSILSIQGVPALCHPGDQPLPLSQPSPCLGPKGILRVRTRSNPGSNLGSNPRVTAMGYLKDVQPKRCFSILRFTSNSHPPHLEVSSFPGSSKGRRVAWSLMSTCQCIPFLEVQCPRLWRSSQSRSSQTTNRTATCACVVFLAQQVSSVATSQVELHIP